MPNMRSSEWCGVSGCFNPNHARGLCANHHNEYKEQGIHSQAVANDEINRWFLTKPAYSPDYYKRIHRTFAQSLPIPVRQQRALARSLNATAHRRGVVK